MDSWIYVILGSYGLASSWSHIFYMLLWIVSLTYPLALSHDPTLKITYRGFVFGCVVKSLTSSLIWSKEWDSLLSGRYGISGEDI